MNEANQEMTEEELKKIRASLWTSDLPITSPTEGEESRAGTETQPA